MITCMKMKSFKLKYASKIMFYAVNIACYQMHSFKVLPKDISAPICWMLDDPLHAVWIFLSANFTRVSAVMHQFKILHDGRSCDAASLHSC